MSMNLGINVVEVDGATPSIQGAPTSVAGFVIRSQRGVPGVVRQVSNFIQFTDYFGGYVAAGNSNPGAPDGTQIHHVGAYAIRGFFDNGGSMAYVSRVVDKKTATAAAATFAMNTANGTIGITITAAFRGQADPGEWGTSLAVIITANPNIIDAFDLTVARTSTVRGITTYKILESWTKLVIGGAPGAQDASVINDPNTGSKYVMFESRPALSWTAKNKYAAGDQVTRGTNVYVTTHGGESGDSGPTGMVGSIPDGEVKWAYVLPSITVAEWQAGHTYAAGNTVTVGTNLYQVTDGGVSASNGPTGTAGSILDDGVKWASVPPWLEKTDYAIGAHVTNGTNVYVATVKGKSGDSGGPTGTAGSIFDDSVTWAYVSNSGTKWQAKHPYALDAVVTNGANVYIVTTDGTSAALHSGPSGTGADITDDQVKWAYLAPDYTPLANGDNGTLSEEELTKEFAAQVTVPSPFDSYDIGLLACPETTDTGVIQAALTYCMNRGDCMFVGHVPDKFGVPEVKAWVKNHNLQGDKVYGALYFPYIQVVDPIGSLIWIPPVGHVMGVYARTDQQRGIWKAPAGNAALVSNALDVRTRLTDPDHTDLVKNGSVNAIRPISGAGIVIDSSRTLSTNTLWLHVNVRLLFNYVKTSLKYGLRWVVQEPNDTALWNKVKYNSVTPFLMGLWRRGAFGPGAPKDVFTVKIDAENNPPANIQQGILNVEVYFYPSRPAETIVITVGQQEGGAKTSES